ncbi:hypothetical protein V5P93_006075 [Actinokineospora auranticolor]|uniref:Lipoprotein n=1 Tax=Actinokineospora auranticolor TaxID=155976 RepID=A0A2S6GG34_9PSEU|nr:hypothetical protein [Actinokineospora auranticolor]PPK64163.1 hypothetical protein CLV40_12127 [Actinokineospora auranticolor]
MRGAAQRGTRARRAALALAALAVTASACSTSVAGTAVPLEIKPISVTAAAAQATRDLREAGLLRYQGSMTTANGIAVQFDLAAAGSGEIAGSLTMGGKRAALVVVEKGIYLKAAADFWASLSGVANGENKGTAVADRWVKAPGGLIGMDFSDVFTPEALSQYLVLNNDQRQDRPVAEGDRADLDGGRFIKVPLARGSAYLSEEAPYGIGHVELSEAGQADPTKVKRFDAAISDATGDLAKFYQDVTTVAGQLTAPVDVLTTVQETGHTFEGCGAEGCSIVVQFTNPGKAAVKVSIRGNWLGDNAPLGACESQAGPVAPGQPGSAKCTITSPEWVQFYSKANAQPGNHPYSVEWSTLVLADAPDLTKLSALAKAAPADAKQQRPEGSHYVYALGFGKGKVFKYGVVAGKMWADNAAQQLPICLSATNAVCQVDLVTATDDAASAQGLLKQLVDAYRSSDGNCPPGQWTGCQR